MPADIKPDALPELKSLATWVSQSAEMKEAKGKKNLLECVDKDRETKARPLLEKLGYAAGHSALLLRICGKASIEKRDTDTDSRTLLFFPLSGDVQVGGEVLKPGTYVQLTKTLDLDAQLDCLIVVLP